MKIFIICVLVVGCFCVVYSQSMQSPSYYNQLFLAFARARVENKQHDAEILKALLMVQEHPSDKKKLAKMCIQFVKDNELKDK